jgi:hypothetical protein
MGLCNYYRKFVKCFSSIGKLLTRLTHIDQEFIWDEPREQTFHELKTRLSLTRILKRPIRGQPFQLHIDWSTLGLKAMLTQLDGDGRKFVMAYAN